MASRMVRQTALAFANSNLAELTTWLESTFFNFAHFRSPGGL